MKKLDVEEFPRTFPPGQAGVEEWGSRGLERRPEDGATEVWV